jgi:dextranase
MLLDVHPDRAFYQPGETVQLSVRATAQTEADVHLVASIAFLSHEVARLAQTLRLVAGETVTAELTWTPPVDAPRGYGVDLHVLDGTGQALATASTAFDVLERWTQAPRYGFLTDFGPDRVDFDRTMLWLTKYHINGLQFYDWMYRHEQLLPPADIFDDSLGRRLSLATVEKLINVAHAWGIAAMPYTAVYAASVPFFQQHSDWALLDAESQPIPFGDDFLMIMNPAPGSPWTEHLLDQFSGVLEKTAFDGIHLDQYGDPKLAFDTRGKRVDLADTLPAFINATKVIVRRHRGDAGAVIFNAVGNWPIETVAPSDEDVIYVEVWPPYTAGGPGGLHQPGLPIQRPSGRRCHLCQRRLPHRAGRTGRDAGRSIRPSSAATTISPCATRTSFLRALKTQRSDGRSGWSSRGSTPMPSALATRCGSSPAKGTAMRRSV